MFRDRVVELLKKEVSVDVDKLLEVPPKPEMGDFAFPCFALAKEIKKAPPEVAKELASKIKTDDTVVKVIALGPYVNFFISPEKYSEAVLKEVSEKKDKYGSSKPQDKTVMVEFSQPNPFKAFHVGHLRGTVLGESLSRVLIFSGKKVIQANYMGDTGAHIGKWLWCYNKFHKGEKPPEKDREAWIASIYVEAVQKTTDNEKNEKEAREINFSLENNLDPNLAELWKEGKQWSMEAFYKIYEDLDANFEVFHFESEMEKLGREIVQKLIEKGIAKESEGVPIMDLEEHGLGVWVLLREDGTTLYSAKDLALAKVKFDEYDIDKSIYVVGNAQALHLRQLFKTLELMGFEHASKCHHLSFDEVRLPEGRMSSRTGKNLLYKDIKKDILKYAIKETKKRHQDWDDEKVNKSAFAIALAALKFGMIVQDTNKKIVFDSKKALDFEGETGPYLQYTHARACSILRKSGVSISTDVDFSQLSGQLEKELMVLLNRFNGVVDEAANNYRSLAVARYAIELAQKFNEFYHTHQCIVDDENVKMARLLLVDAVRQVLHNALYLLTLKAPEQM